MLNKLNKLYLISLLIWLIDGKLIHLFREGQITVALQAKLWACYTFFSVVRLHGSSSLTQPLLKCNEEGSTPTPACQPSEWVFLRKHSPVSLSSEGCGEGRIQTETKSLSLSTKWKATHQNSSDVSTESHMLFESHGNGNHLDMNPR